MSNEKMFNAIELDLQMTDEQRVAVMRRLRDRHLVNPDGSVSQHFWIKFCREEMAKAEPLPSPPSEV